MLIISMAWKNIWCNKARTAVTMSAIFFAVILSVLANSLQDGIFNNLIKNVVSFYTGYMQVHKTGYWNEQILDNSFHKDESTEKKIKDVPNVSGITARLESFALVSSGELTKGCLVLGIEPEKENQITFLKDKLSAGSYLKDSSRAVLLSEGLARRLKIGVADTIVLIGQGYHGSTAAGKYPVRGIVRFGSPELNDKALFMPLAAAQDLYGAYGMITSYILSFHDPDNILPASVSLKNKLPHSFEVMSWEELLPDVKQHIHADTNNMKYVQGILYMLICFGIFGTLLMMMVERKFEMGVLVAIGMKKSKLMLLFLLESLFTVITGCLLGVLFSIPLVYYLNVHPVRIGGETARAYERFGFEPVFPTSLEASNFINQGFIVLIIGFALSVYPVYKVIRLDPVTAMRP